MAATFHLQVLQAVQAALQDLSAVPSDRVFLQLPAPLEREQCPAIDITPGDGRADRAIGTDGDYDLLEVRFAFTLHVHTRGDPPAELADPVIAEANAALMADPSLGGKALRLRFTGSHPATQAADTTAGTYDLNYEATLAVNERTLRLQPL